MFLPEPAGRHQSRLRQFAARLADPGTPRRARAAPSPARSAHRYPTVNGDGRVAGRREVSRVDADGNHPHPLGRDVQPSLMNGA